ncbi:glutathione-disulfide reductase [Allopusillimonas soli]|uniref:Glutathione reductase n=1 Tax=Allopusillimonas soli TaxID=659016 RepID=A0A853F6P3_9BURK|nr:glutathione-disulfide reductase [Allopusillimonas soli]NYT36245.1 glutathione-disulfide reductase [Allopusillimonas soli]TEA76570.1 glutathione-disulfide reductase [Allopusillimonas soli]
MNQFDVDLFVIGAGSGGVRAARVAAGHGARVMVAESDRVGGTCVIRGCVPKKLMVLAGRYADDFTDAASFGWRIDTPRHDWAALIAAKDKEIARLEGIYTRNLASSNVTLKHDHASIVDAHTVRLDGSGETIRARHILVATGSRPMKDGSIPGMDLAVTSNEMFHLPALPKRLAIIGGGYIAVEFAGLMHALGSEVTLIHRRDRLLRGFDEDIRTALGAAYKERGITLRLGHTVQRLDQTPQGTALTFMDGSSATYDLVMLATGRLPNIQGLGLENAGVTLENGAIAVDAYSTTNVPSIHAVGDVTNRANLTPVAIREGQALANTLFGNMPTTVRHDLIPTAVFSTPEIGTVGLTEAAARDQGRDIAVFQTSFRPIKATLSGREERTMMKLLVDDADDRVLGVHIVGESAGELIQLAGVALTCGATKQQFDDTIAVHPTAAEELVTMRTPVARTKTEDAALAAN